MSYQTGPRIVTDGLVFYVDAADANSYPGSGTTWTDLSGNGNNGTLTNGPTFSSANRGSIVFDGTNDYIDIPNTSTYQFTNTQPFTLSAWVNSSNLTGYDNIVAFALNSGNNRGYYLVLISGVDSRTNSFLFDYYDGTLFRGIIGNNNSITTGSWINLAATSSSNSVNDMKVYQNGVLTSWTNRGSQTPSSINYTSVPLRIGSRETGATFSGNISSVQIYNRALSASEVLQNYNATKGRYGF